MTPEQLAELEASEAARRQHRAEVEAFLDAVFCPDGPQHLVVGGRCRRCRREVPWPWLPEEISGSGSSPAGSQPKT